MTGGVPQGGAADPAVWVFARRDDASWPATLPRRDHLLALAITALVHLLLVATLRVDGVLDTDAVARDEGVPILWIERPSATPPQAAPEPHPSASRLRQAARRTSPVHRDDAFPARSSARDDVPLQVVEGGDAWSEPAGSTSRTRDIDPSAFRRDPLARRDTTFEPAPARMEAAIRDRSFGGWMQRTTKARICGDLAAQLRKSPESTEAVAASMRKHGCRV